MAIGGKSRLICTQYKPSNVFSQVYSSQARGLRADQIRLQREDVLLKIAKKARSRLDFENRTRVSVPNKYLVPFLERASLEGDDEQLIDWWSSLLVSAATDEAFQRPIFIDIMGKLTVVEANFLEGLWNSAGGRQRISTSLLQHLEDGLRTSILMGCDVQMAEEYTKAIPKILAERMENWRSGGIFCRSLSYPAEAGRNFVQGVLEEDVELDVSVVLGLLNRSTLDLSVPSPWIGDFRCSGEFFAFSDIGSAFMNACHARRR